MSQRENSQEYRINETVFRWTSYLLVALMVACSAWTLGSLLSRLMLFWQTWLMAAVCFLVALDSLYISRRLKNLTIFSKEWLITFSTQWIVILMLVKVLTGLSHGVDAFLAEIPLWWKGFSSHFMTGDFLIAVVMVVIAWFVSGYFAGLLDEMGIDHALIALDMESAAHRYELDARDRLLSLIFTICTILVMITALVRVNLRAVFAGQFESLFYDLPILAGGGASTLAYFMFGLALLSQTQFISLHTRWNLAHIPVSNKLAGRWALYSILFLAILAGLVSLLPTSYSMGLLLSLGHLLDFFVQLFYFIVQFVFAILAFLLNLLFSLFGGNSPFGNNAFPSRDLPELLNKETAGGSSLPWLDMAKSIAFWVIFLGVIFFSFSQYLRQHQEVLHGLRKLPGWQILLRFWHWIRARFAGAKRGISKMVETGRERLRARRGLGAGASKGRHLNLRRLNARQKVYFFYLALVRRGGERGLPRSPSQTPSEYAATLDDALPAADEDIDSLTDAFVEARYSRHPIQSEEANRVRTTWERIRKVMRGKK